MNRLCLYLHFTFIKFCHFTINLHLMIKVKDDKYDEET